jgi:hypothetical protein
MLRLKAIGAQSQIYLSLLSMKVLLLKLLLFLA